MRRTAPHPIRLLPLLLFAAAACTDRNPAGAPEPAPSAAPPSAVAMLTCTVSVADGTMGCRAPDAAGAPGTSAAIIGGQDAYVRLTSRDVSYDGTSVFRANVTVQNLTEQALGTSDGATPSPDGVRVFFSTPPVATGGSGAVEVANADGEAFFTTAAQKYFRYDGILPPGDTSAAREWRFTVPSTVTTFSFGVYVAAPVQAETGGLRLYPLAPTLQPGWTMPLSAVLFNVAGSVLPDEPVSWTTSNPSTVTVDSSGVITGVAVGSATVTASSAGHTARVRVEVDAPGNLVVATVSDLYFRRDAILANGADTLAFWAEYQVGPGSPHNVTVYMVHPTGAERICRGSIGYCPMTFPEGTLGGTWEIEWVQVANRIIYHAELLAAGWPAHVYVRSHAEDRTPPAVDSAALATQAVTPLDSVRITVRARDAGVGVERAEAWVSSPGNPQMRWPSRRSEALGNGAVRLTFANLVPAYYHGGTFTLDSVRVQDYNAQRTTLTTAQLAAMGARTQFTVTGTTPDTAGPTITGFSFSPDTIAGNGMDRVTVTLSASEPDHESGVWFLDMEFEKISDPTQLRRCLLNGATRVFTRTMTCSRTFAAADAGAWRVRFVRAIDWMDNERVLFPADLTAAGYPTLLVVNGATPDRSPPAITGFGFSPGTVRGNGADSVTVTLSAAEPEGETGMYYADAVLERVSDPTQYRWCRASDAGAPRTLTITCREAFSAAEAGAWRVRYIRAIDVAYNARVLRNADLRAAGYPTDLTVTAP